MSRRILLKVLSVGLPFLAACVGGEVPPTDQVNRSAGTVSALVNGEQYSATTNVTSINNGADLRITATDQLGRSFGFDLKNPPAHGDVQLGGATGTFVTYLLGQLLWTSQTAPATGTVTMSSRTTSSASGTFAFTLAPVTSTGATVPITVSQGVFSVTF